MQILYGIHENQCTDVTHFFDDKDFIYIPLGDGERAELFGDPVPGVEKHIVVIDDYGYVRRYAASILVFLSKDIHGMYNVNSTENVHQLLHLNLSRVRLELMHAYTYFIHGSLKDEYSEQFMAASFLKPDDYVLELGANIGRNSCIIASILSDSSHLVSFESSKQIIPYLQDNRDVNQFRFHIEPSALSKRKLIQKDWDTKPLGDHEEIEEGWEEVGIISWEQTRSKYNMPFNALVLDCEGAIYYILKDEPEFLKDFNIVIIENDFHEQEHRSFVKEEFLRNGFKVVYSEHGGWGICTSFFYEVWKKED